MINRVVLVGRLTKDPELKYTKNGVAMTRFTLAVNRPFKNQQGENEADFINCIAWRRQAENTATYVGKGSLIGIDGRIQTSNFEGQDGQRVFMTEVVADSVQFLEPRGASQQRQPQSGFGAPSFGGQPAQSNQPFGGSQQQNAGMTPPFQQNTQPQQQNENYTNINDDPFSKGGSVDVSDDDLPF